MGRYAPNPQHLEIARQGASAINLYRENDHGMFDLSGADLSGLRLAGADLAGALLIEADLEYATLNEAILHDANLRGANLQGAQLFGANLTAADLSGADLRRADLMLANLQSAKLDGADFADSVFAATALGDVDLGVARNLERVRHHSRCSVGIDALLNSTGSIPESFLRGCGVPEIVIEFLPSMRGPALEFYSAFISYSSADRSFAVRLHDALQGRGIRCWRDEHQLVPGADIRDAISEGIRVWDKLILCASEQSLVSWWVERELKTAFAKEEQLSKQSGSSVRAVIPLNLDGHLFLRDSGGAFRYQGGWAEEIRSRHAADFTGWETSNGKFEEQLERVVKALRSDPKANPPPPAPKLGRR